MGKTFISVILPLRLSWTPYYYVESPSSAESPDGQASPVRRGDRVRVMLSGRYYHGVVCQTGVKPEIDESRIREITAIESLERISEEELRLWEFMADYYMCSIGEVFKAAYPIGRVSEEQIGEQIKLRKEAQRLRRLEALEKKKASLESRIKRKQEELAILNAKAEADAFRTEASKEKNSEKIKLTVSQLQELSEQLIEINSPETDVPENTKIAFPDISLSGAQQKAYNLILKAFSNNKITLLNGITGSGKTEIYCKLAMDTLRRGRNVLYLVPEIALSRQLEDRLKKIFGDRLLVSHSGESYARRREVASSLREKPYVLLGTRSSIFLPQRRLGLVIVDEEHDTSYKQDSPAPRYNARDCALVMAGNFGANVILGSATPSMESLYNASRGRYELVSLTQRYYAGDDTQVEVIDTIAERKKRGMVGSFSRKLIAHIYDTLNRGEQVVILRARRAYAPFVQCDSCGDIPKCPNCNVTLSYHKDRNRLLCHYCGHSEVFSDTCPKCGGKRLLRGSGTQKIEEEVAALFPNARVARLDGDSLSSSARIIDDFASGRTDILVGTQMVSKGFDFENLTLVAVIQGDSLLGQQDFRADERAVQLFEQLRGRGGRRGKKSLFVIQTSQPDHPVYTHLSTGSDFVSGEMAMRREFGFPPYTRIVRLLLKDSNLPRLEKLSGQLSMVLAREFGVSPSVTTGDRGESAMVISYPYPPVVDQIAGEAIRHIRITLRRDRRLAANKRKISAVIARFETEKSWTGHIAVDVDPV